ncbi:MAG: hypothetical protein KJ000_28910 [Pirellulaceae bacterium]|nr:hypothetical protein [Pirellulaceae bacterium]
MSCVPTLLSEAKSGGGAAWRSEWDGSVWRRLRLARAASQKLGWFGERSAEGRRVGRLRSSVQRGCPFGAEVWQQSTAKQLGLEFTLCPRGHPRKKQ